MPIYGHMTSLSLFLLFLVFHWSICWFPMSSCSTSSPSGGNKVKVEVEVEFSPVFDLLSLCLNNVNVGKVRHDPATGVSHVLVKSRVTRLCCDDCDRLQMHDSRLSFNVSPLGWTWRRRMTLTRGVCQRERSCFCCFQRRLASWTLPRCWTERRQLTASQCLWKQCFVLFFWWMASKCFHSLRWWENSRSVSVCLNESLWKAALLIPAKLFPVRIPRMQEPPSTN